MKLTSIKAILLALPILFYACDSSSEQAKKDQSTDSTQKKEGEGQKDQSATASSIKIDEMATSRANLWAAKPVSSTDFGSISAMPAVKEHYTQMNKGWTNYKGDVNKGWEGLDETYLAPLRAWRDKEISDFNKEGNNLFYPFSGPDILNAYNLFPDMDNYVMIGLEKVGELPEDFSKKDEKYVSNYLRNIRTALEDIFMRNYFITSYMGSDLYKVSKGVLPIINVFLAHTENEIVSINRVVIGEDGKPILKDMKAPDEASDKVVTGLAIKFKNAKKDRIQTVYYFGFDISDAKLTEKMEFDTFLRSFPNKVGYLKSASYVLFNTGFNVINNIIKDDAIGVLQDDTGAPYRSYVESGKWDIQLYGNYANPVADFGKYTHQPTLRAAYANPANNVKKLGFPYGYQWRDVNKVSLLVLRKKK